jgi:hypothetical protein
MHFVWHFEFLIGNAAPESFEIQIALGLCYYQWQRVESVIQIYDCFHHVS